MEYIYEDLTHTLIGCFFKIHNSLGVGLDEKAYHKALEHYFRKLEIEHQSKERKALIHRGVKVREYEADFVVLSVFKMKPLLVENRIICDIKALTDEIDFYDITRIQSYLRALGLKIGIIVNFGKNELEIRGIRA